MKILCIDYGKKKTGLATTEGVLAEPWKVIKTSQIKEILKKEKFDKIIVGVSYGEMGKEQKKFAKEIGAETFDETLTTKMAQNLSFAAGIARDRRKGMEDAFAAALTLQNYLDEKS